MSQPLPESCTLPLQLIFAVIVATGTFFLVPRGVSLGEISVQTEHRTWNFSEHTYKLNLIAQIPVNNPNYLSVSLQAPVTKTACIVSLLCCVYVAILLDDVMKSISMPTVNQTCIKREI